jgi:hypothetical protein
MSVLALLIQAAQSNDIGAVRLILDSNHEIVNEKDASGATALHYAALSGHRTIVKLLVERGADVNDRDGEFGATPAGRLNICESWADISLLNWMTWLMRLRAMTASGSHAFSVDSQSYATRLQQAKDILAAGDRVCRSNDRCTVRDNLA